MTRVLYIGVYRDGTGWGQAATDYVLALDAAGIDVVPRPLKLNGRDHQPPPRLLELERKPTRGCDVVIQHVLPHMMDYNGCFRRCIGLFASETSDFRASGWAERLNLMDEAWVINRQQVEACRHSGVCRPVHVVPHATDVTRFQRSYPVPEQLRPHREQGDFLFYFIGEYVRRKNLAALVKAFHLEFDPSEPVGLVIKTDRAGLRQADVRDFCSKVRDGLKLVGAREEIILVGRLSDEELLGLHAACDCFVQPSYGEAWSIPAFDAMAMGKVPIVTACTGYLDYLSNDTGWLVPGRSEPVFGVDDVPDGLFSGQENWVSVDIGQLRQVMRQAYEDRALRQEKAARGIERAHDFSYQAVGALMGRLLAETRRQDDDHLARTEGPRGTG